MERINNYIRCFQQKGFDLADANLRAMKVMENIVNKQSALLSYRDAFLLVGILFAMTLPLLVLAARQSNKKKVDLVAISDH